MRRRLTNAEQDRLCASGFDMRRFTPRSRTRRSDGQHLDDELEQLLTWVDSWLAAQGVEHLGRAAKYRLLLGVIANNGELLNRLPAELARKMQAAARAEGLLKEATG